MAQLLQINLHYFIIIVFALVVFAMTDMQKQKSNFIKTFYTSLSISFEVAPQYHSVIKKPHKRAGDSMVIPHPHHTILSPFAKVHTEKK